MEIWTKPILHNLCKDLARFLNCDYSSGCHIKENNFTSTDQFISLFLFLISLSRTTVRFSLHNSEVMNLPEQSVFFCFQVCD